ncbi:hypothetical protein JCM8097_005589 [Rhodosporidiobolus ruineniae]
MPPVDPGSTVRWAKHPAYSHALLTAIANLASRNTQHALFSSAAGRNQHWKTSRQQALADVTAQVFTSVGDTDRAKKQQESTQRRITQLGKDYTSDINTIVADPYSVSTTRDQVRLSNPFFDALRGILHDHPDFPTWDENADDRPLDDDPMQDVQHPHQPVAGPAYPNPNLPHHAPHLPPNPAPPPQPAPAPPGNWPASPPFARHHSRPSRSPSPVRVPPPPQPQPPAQPVQQQQQQPPPPAAAAAAAVAAVAAEDDSLSHCPVCDAPLSALPASDSEAHLARCLSSHTSGGAGEAEGAYLPACPACGTSFEGTNGPPGTLGHGRQWTRERREEHVMSCVSGGGGRAVREHVVFVADEKSAPKDDKTGEYLECTFCFDSLAPSESLARLNCHCVYHAACVEEYWQQPGRWCPTHRELDTEREVEMR